MSHIFKPLGGGLLSNKRIQWSFIVIPSLGINVKMQNMYVIILFLLFSYLLYLFMLVLRDASASACGYMRSTDMCMSVKPLTGRVFKLTF